MWSMVLQWALIAFLALAAAAIGFVFVRNVRAKGFPTRESSSQYDQMKGAMPPMPAPDGPERRSQNTEPDRPH